MNRDDFAKVFEQYQEDARRAVLGKFGGDAALAADAVQEAALYVLEHLGRFKKLTRSYLVQLAINRARNIRRGETRQQMRVTSIGGEQELLIAEEIAESKRRGGTRQSEMPEEQRYSWGGRA